MAVCFGQCVGSASNPINVRLKPHPREPNQTLTRRYAGVLAQTGGIVSKSVQNDCDRSITLLLSVTIEARQKAESERIMNEQQQKEPEGPTQGTDEGGGL